MSLALKPFKAFQKRVGVEEMLLRGFHKGVGKTVPGESGSPAGVSDRLVPALNLDFPVLLTAPSPHFLQLFSKGKKMLFSLCFIQRHVLLMRPSRTVAYSHEKILFQATDM